MREDLHSRLTKAQRDARALHAGYRALRHRFEDVAPTDTALNGGSDGDDSIQRLHVPHEDTMCLGRGSHSSTFRLNVSAFCGIRWVHGFPPVYYTGGHGEV